MKVVNEMVMQQETMLLISEEQVKSLIDRLKSSSNLDECMGEVRKMLEIKDALLWRADAAACR